MIFTPLLNPINNYKIGKRDSLQIYLMLKRNYFQFGKKIVACCERTMDFT